MRRVYVGRLNHYVRERDIERFFRSEGKIREVLMKDGFAFVEFDHTEDAEAAVRRMNGRDLNGDRVHVEFAKGPPRGREPGGPGGVGMGGRSMGLGRGPMSRNGPSSRNFRTDRGRDRGDNHGGGRSTGGISYAEKYGPPRNTDYRVIVENLSSRVSWQDLKDLMRQAGEVTFADAHKRERNMGIVDFASLKDMKHAIDTLNDTEFHGRRIKIYEDKSRRHRGSGSAGGGGNRRGFDDRSRSRSRGRYSSSRSRSRDRPTMVSRSRSRSPVARGHEEQSRSRSASSSPARRKNQRSRSRSRSRSRDSPQSERQQSRSRSPSRSRSSSRSAADSSSKRKSISRSRSVSSTRSQNSNVNIHKTNNNNNNNDDDSNKPSGGDKDRDSSRSHSSRSASRSPYSKKARVSRSASSQSEKANLEDDN